MKDDMVSLDGLKALADCEPQLMARLYRALDCDPAQILRMAERRQLVDGG